MSEREKSSIKVRAASGSVRRVVRNMLRRSILALTALAALVFVPAGPSRAQSQSAASKSAPAGAIVPSVVAVASPAAVAQEIAPKPVAEPSASKGQHEGITVHGHWTIVVRNPDGTVATRREFENSLVNNVGPNLLAGLLSGNFAVGPWSITLRGAPGPCGTYLVPGLGQCNIVPGNTPTQAAGCSPTPTPVSSGTQPYCYDDLMESLTGAGTYFTSFTMSGAVYADQASTVSSVGTYLTTCPGAGATTTPVAPGTPVAPTTTSPSACLLTTESGNVPFTSTTLANSIAVAAGQTVSATVVISFQ